MSQTTPSQYPNVNFLALISRVLDEANSKEKCELDSPVRIREAKILDSLASIGVWRAQKQVVAAASHFVEDSQHGGKSVVILIAENGPIDKRTVNHIQDVLSRLVTIHTYFREEGLSQDGTLSPIQEYISIVPQSRFETGLLDLELAIIEHSWKKLRQRLFKNCRHTNFLDTARDVCNPDSPDTLENIDTHSFLKQLRISPEVTKKTIEKMVVSVEMLCKIFQSPEPSLSRVKEARITLASLDFGRKLLVGKDVYLLAWNLHTRRKSLS